MGHNTRTKAPRAGMRYDTVSDRRAGVAVLISVRTITVPLPPLKHNPLERYVTDKYTSHFFNKR